MRRIFLWALLFLFPLACGCSWSRALFDTFGSAYSGGGYTMEDKEADYERSVQSYQP